MAMTIALHVSGLHLSEAVSDNPCMDCRFMPHVLRLARLAEVEGGPGLPPSGVGPSGSRRRASAAGRPPGKSCEVDKLANQVDTLSDEVAQIKALLQNLQPAQAVPAVVPAAAQPNYPEDDMLSTAASCSLFIEEEEGVDEEAPLRPSQVGSVSGRDTAKPAVGMALERLGTHC
ncbi:unnamed protein product [Boreogadus saida]